MSHLAFLILSLFRERKLFIEKRGYPPDTVLVSENIYKQCFSENTQVKPTIFGMTVKTNSYLDFHDVVIFREIDLEIKLEAI